MKKPVKPKSAPEHIKDLKPDPENLRLHNPRNVGMIRDALGEVGAARSIVIDETNTVLAGNATLEAAGEAGITKLQVVDADGETIVAVRRTGLTARQKKRLAAFDNRTAELATWDTTNVADLLAADAKAFEGMFAEDEIAQLLGTDNDNTYTSKTVSPVYTPKGERPPLTALVDHQKADELLAGIDAAKLPEGVTQFLKLAAERHTVFNFRQIAEFYCHADAKVQDLMERSGLVIIDFKKAIEYGFVYMTEKLGALADQEEAANGNA